jgi:hypothetical protein
MAKIKKRSKMDLSAMTSDQVKVQKVGNRGTIISVVEPPRKSRSKKKEKSNNRFKAASHWAMTTLQLPAKKELYSKGITAELNNARLVAISDFMNAPKIHYIKFENYAGVVGDRLRIKATDAFRIPGVTVSISRKDGRQLEEGAAVRDRRKPVMWIYTATVSNPELPGTMITVTVEDLPGNKALLELTIGDEGRGQGQVTKSEVTLAKYKFFDRKSQKMIEV